MSNSAPTASGATPRVNRIRRAVRWLLVSLAILAVLAGMLFAGAYRQLDRNIASEQVEDLLGERPPVVSGGPNLPTPGAAPSMARRALNILVIGSDTRAGKNARYGDRITGARGDVTLLVHVSADRQRAVAVSIPRDSIVRIPGCQRADGTTVPAGLDLFNSAYSRGGPACAIRTVESLTRIYVDHYVVVDFDGFKRMVDALGKVRICVPRDVADEKSQLRLSAGSHDVDGETALAYVRNRSLDGSGDIGRIRRQQAFLAAVISKATSTGVLVNPKRFYDFLDAATRSITTDPALGSLSALRRLALDLRDIDSKSFRFLTVPWRVYPPDSNRVQWTGQADELWRLLREDRPVPGAWKDRRGGGRSTAGLCQ